MNVVILMHNVHCSKAFLWLTLTLSHIPLVIDKLTHSCQCMYLPHASAYKYDFRLKIVLRSCRESTDHLYRMDGHRCIHTTHCHYAVTLRHNNSVFILSLFNITNYFSARARGHLSNHTSTVYKSCHLGSTWQ